MFFIMQERLNHCYLMFLLSLFIKGHQGFFIKHSSGLCLQSAPQYRLKGNDRASDPITSRWGPLYVVHFYNTCLHPDAQFRFLEPYSVLHNIGKNGTFLARDLSKSNGYKRRFVIYHSPIPPAANVFIYSRPFALKQRSGGALQLHNGYCPTPVKEGTSRKPTRPFYPQNGNGVYNTKNCDMEDQKFIFGSVTCEGNVATDVSCNKDQVMVIQDAVYGRRSDMKTCGYNENKNCTVSVTCVVKGHCDGKQKCSINVNQALFNIDPCPGKSKYLYFEYICADTKPGKQLTGLICSEPLLEDTSNFPGSIFTALNYIDNHPPDKARISSGSSWCASSNGKSYLEIDLRVKYVINNVAIFGDAVSANWVTSYKLSYTSDGGTNKEILGNKNACNDVSTINLNGVRARILRFTPVSSHGNPCMRIEICGHKLFPDQPRKLTLTKLTSSYVSFSWIPPIIDKWEKPILYYRIKMQENISRSVVLNINHTNAINEKEVQDLLPYTAYELSIAAGNVYGFGKETTVIFTTAETAPSGPPRDVSVIAQSASSLSASWKEPAEDKKNGVITNYTACISQFKDGSCFQMRTIVDKTVIFDNLKSSTKYFVRVLASTNVGSGIFSESKARFTNAKPPQQPSGGTLNTLSLVFEIPSSNYIYFKVIVLKLSDGKVPSSSPDSYSESDLVTYAEAKSSPQPKPPYIAAVIKISNDVKGEFKLGDGSSSTLPTRRRRRSNSCAYHNAPLDPGTSYSVFQRVYDDKGNYYSSGWSPAARTETPPSKESVGSKTTPLYIVIAISWVIITVLIVVVVYLTVCRRRSHSPRTKDGGDTYEEVQIPLSSSKDQNYENPNNGSSSQYEELQHHRKDEDEHNYQSLQKTT